MRTTLCLIVTLWLHLVAANLWDYAYPSPFGRVDITAAANGANTFVLVGAQGTLIQSTDGVTWSHCPSPLDGNYYFVDYTNGFYIVTDQNKALAFSSSPTCTETSWISGTTAQLDHIEGLTTTPSPPEPDWNRGFVGTNRQQLYYSSTGSPGTFTQVTTLDNAVWGVWAVTYGQNFWLAKLGQLPVGTDPVPIYTISSNNGASGTWSAPLPTGLTAKYDYGFSFCPKSDQFIGSFAEGIAISPNGFNWTIIVESPDYLLATIVCDSSDRCVGSNSTHIFDAKNCGQDGFSVKKLAIDYILNDFPVYGTVLQNGQQKDLFVVAGPLGAAFSSSEYGIWNSFGSTPDESDLFDTCTELLWVEQQQYFAMNCHRSVLVSPDAQDWNIHRYNLDKAGLFQLQSIAPGENSMFYGFANQNLLFFSLDGTYSWEEYIRISIREDDDDMTLIGIQNVHDHWITYGYDTLSATDSTLIPIFAQSVDGVFWEIAASGAWINQVEYSGLLGRYVAAGRNGIYLADPKNITYWVRVSETNGDCFAIATNGVSKFVALCDNTQGNVVDSIVKVSSDGGQSWVNYASPCVNVDKIGVVANYDCSRLAYIEDWNSFIIASSAASGVMYSSNPSVGNWAQISWPYATRFVDFVQGGPHLVTLTSTLAVYSGGIETQVLGNFSAGVVYTGDSTSSQPEYPLVGPIWVLPPPESVASNLQQSSDSEGEFNGAQIFGIVFGALVATLIVFICFPILVFGVILLKRKFGKKSPEAMPFAVNYSNQDEDDAL